MAAVYAATATKQKLTLHRPEGPMVVDVWNPVVPSGEPPVLLVHGWGGTGSYWAYTANELSQTVKVIVPDLPGTGRSQPVLKAQTMFDQVKALTDLVDTLELETVQVVGHSMGGAMVLLLAEKRPQEIERIVLTSLTFFRTWSQKEIYRSVMRAFKASMRLRGEWMAAVPGMERMMAKNYFYRVPDNTPLLKQGLMDFLQLDKGTAAACADDATDPAIPAAGAKVRVPVMLVACRQDNMMPMENVDHTANIIPDCDVRWIEECGHLPMVEKPDEYLSILRDFLRLGVEH